MAITIHNERPLGYKEFFGLSTDDKPTEDVAVNSLFLELDTGDFYYCESQGSKGESTKNYIVEEDTFTSTTITLVPPYYHEFSPSVIIDEDSIIVVFDGVTYNCPKMDGDDFAGWIGSVLYGGEPSGSAFDSSEYPFMIIGEEGQIMVEDKNEHTIEIYTLSNNDTPAVWKKVGSGGSEPLVLVDGLVPVGGDMNS